MRKKLASLLLLAFLLSTGYAAYYQLRAATTSVSHYQPSAAQLPLTIGDQPALSSRVLLIVLDGWRPDAATKMASIHYLRRQGAAFTLEAPPPTWVRPTWASLLTGTGPTQHGVLLDRPGGALTVDNLAQAAGRRGLTVSLVGDPGLAELLSPWLERTYPAQGVSAVKAATLPLLATGEAPPLLLVHLDFSQEPDATEVDLFLMEVIRSIDLTQETLVISGTYAVDRQGRHGAGTPQQSRVPLVLAGRGVSPGEFGPAKLIDLTPTVATLLGLPLPSSATGTPLFSALTLTGEPLSARQQEVAKAQAQLKQPKVELLQFDWQEPQPYIAGAALLLLLYLLFVNRGRLAGPFFASLTLYLLSYHALFLLRGGRYDLSLPGLGQPDRSFLIARGLEIVLAWALTAVSLGWLVGRRAQQPGDKGLGSLYTLGSFAALLTLAALLPIGLYGLDPRPVLLNPTWVIPYLALLSHLMILGAGAPLWWFISLVSAKLADQPLPSAEEADQETRIVEIDQYRKQRRTSRRGTTENRR